MYPERNKNIGFCVMTILEQNMISVNMKTTLWPWPFDLKMRLEKSVDLTNSPQIWASLENNVLLGKIVSLLKVLPEGINIDGDRVIIDIKAFLTPEQKQIINLIKSVEIKTEPGKVIFDVNIKVD
jgi:hypothetical protein